jgi:hypothetical protein
MAPRERHTTHAQEIVVPSVVPRTIRKVAFVAAGNRGRSRRRISSSHPRPGFRALMVAVCRSPPQPHHVLSSHDTTLTMSCCRCIAAS